jgi:hypothetical protein
MKCSTCGYDDHGTGDSAHHCATPGFAAPLPAAPAPTEPASTIDTPEFMELLGEYGFAVAVNDKPLADTVRDGIVVYIDQCHRAALAARQAPADDYTLDDVDLARRLLTEMGRAIGPSREPGANRDVDRLAALIGANFTARQVGAPDGAVARDAARWRFVREHPAMSMPMIKNLMVGNLPLDESIDAAITQEKAS